MNTGLPFLTYGVILRGRYVIDSVIGSGYIIWISFVGG